MKNWISRIFFVAIGAAVCVSAVSAQRDTLGAAAGDRYVISAKAGGVNYVSGPVGVVRTEGKSGQLLKGDKLEIGDRVSTGEDGKAEILLNPGSYLRLGPLSAFEFKATDLDDLQIRLDSGSAIFEVFATEDFTVTVNTPQTKFTLIDSGVYRVDADGRISVWKGKARLGDDEKALVKSGREGVLTNAQAVISKFDRDDKDELEIWSKDRAKELARVQSKLQQNTMRTALMRSYLGRQWNMYSSFGLWVFDPFTGSHCFMPFGWGWASPYGYGFGHNIWSYNLPRVIYMPPTPPTGSGPVRTVANTKPRGAGITPTRPPFAQVQGSSGATGRDVSPVRPGRGDIGGGGPTFSPVRPAGASFPSSSSPSAAPPRVVSNTKGVRP